MARIRCTKTLFNMRLCTIEYIHRRERCRLLIIVYVRISYSTDAIMLKEYPESLEGIIESFIDRYNMNTIDELLALSLKDAEYFC